MNPVNELIQKTITGRRRFRTSRLAQITPFMSRLGTGPSLSKGVLVGARNGDITETSAFLYLNLFSASLQVNE